MFAKVKGPYFPLMRIGGWYSVGMSPELADLMDKKERNEASAAELKRIEQVKKVYWNDVYNEISARGTEAD